jgi:flagellar hook assembly protein FlgD
VGEPFQICKNVFNVTVDGKLCITIGTAQFPGNFELHIYNTAGEHVKTLYQKYISAPQPAITVEWDGSNKFGQKVSSGVYIIYFIKPYGRLMARVIVIH